MWKFTNKYAPNNTHGKISKFSRNIYQQQNTQDRACMIALYVMFTETHLSDISWMILLIIK